MFSIPKILVTQTAESCYAFSTEVLESNGRVNARGIRTEEALTRESSVEPPPAQSACSLVLRSKTSVTKRKMKMRSASLVIQEPTTSEVQLFAKQEMFVWTPKLVFVLNILMKRENSLFVEAVRWNGHASDFAAWYFRVTGERLLDAEQNSVTPCFKIQHHEQPNSDYKWSIKGDLRHGKLSKLLLPKEFRLKSSSLTQNATHSLGTVKDCIQYLGFRLKKKQDAAAIRSNIPVAFHKYLD